MGKHLVYSRFYFYAEFISGFPELSILKFYIFHESFKRFPAFSSKILLFFRCPFRFFYRRGFVVLSLIVCIIFKPINFIYEKKDPFENQQGLEAFFRDHADRGSNLLIQFQE